MKDATTKTMEALKAGVARTRSLFSRSRLGMLFPSARRFDAHKRLRLPVTESMALGESLGACGGLGFVRAHVSPPAGTIGLLFLQRYTWLLRIAKQGFGQYQAFSYLAGVSARKKDQMR
jgi:hypothetical protein